MWKILLVEEIIIGWASKILRIIPVNIQCSYWAGTRRRKERKENVIYSLFQLGFGALTAAARPSINTTEERISRIYLLDHSPSELHANKVAGKQL